MRSPRRCATILLCALACSTASCSRRSAAEESIVGTWEWTNMHGDTGHVVFRRDHSTVDLFPDWYFLGGRMYTAGTGAWHLEGDVLVSEVQPFSLAGKPELPKRVMRMTLPDPQTGRITHEGHSDLAPASTAELRYAQLLFALCIAASSALLLAFGRGVRGGALGSVFIWLALGAAAALFYFLLRFVDALAQTGDVIASFEFLRSLRRPCEVLEVISAIIFMLGSVKLFRHLRRTATDERI